ncbi:MAG: NADPH:quinone reductase [Actinobacteria bacterium 13_2_20CM_2_71_6]|nr:MAG: NADPH:quinone reductase [Actinobacteria bacterium 13_2_20CM_2_71_6]
MLAITQESFGGPEVLTVTEVDPPRPLPTEVLVRVHAVGVNPVESFIRSGAFPLLGPPPFVLGWEISGVVEEVVPGTERFRPGDEVYGMPFFPRAASGYAEYVAAPSRMLARKPATVDHVHAAALPLVGLTAWQGLVEYARIAAGQTVLIHGAGGGVGHLAVQIAKSRGAHVIGTASAGKHDFVRQLGADELIDYRAVDFAEVVRDADVVFDVIGGDYGPRSLRCLRPGGVFVTAVDRTDAELAVRARAAGMRFVGVAVEPDHVGLERLTELVDAGRLRPHVEHVLPLVEAAKAHVLSDTGHITGKIVLTT